MGWELGRVRERGAAIDYLLLRHKQGCDDFKGRSRFNLTDNSELTEHKLQKVKGALSHVKQGEGFFTKELAARPPGYPAGLG